MNARNVRVGSEADISGWRLNARFARNTDAAGEDMCGNFITLTQALGSRSAASRLPGAMASSVRPGSTVPHLLRQHAFRAEPQHQPHHEQAHVRSGVDQAQANRARHVADGRRFAGRPRRHVLPYAYSACVASSDGVSDPRRMPRLPFRRSRRSAKSDIGSVYSSSVTAASPSTSNCWNSRTIWRR